jgi:hypothetical protein
MASINPAVQPAIRIMRHNIETLKFTTLPSGTRSAIRRQAIACKDAMSAAYEASVKDSDWRELERLVDTVLLATATQDLRTREMAE